MFTDRNNVTLSDSLEIKYPVISSFLFFLFSFIYDGPKIYSLIQNVIAIIAILSYNYYIGPKIALFLKNIEKKNMDYFGKLFCYFAPTFIVVYFIICFFFKICELFLKNKLYCSYIEMAIDIFKEIGKYFSFVFVINLYYLFNKYIKEYSNYDKTNQRVENAVNITSISSITY